MIVGRYFLQCTFIVKSEMKYCMYEECFEKFDKWKHSIIVCIPKKGNSSSLENQRGIANFCAFAKLINKLLLVRIRDIIEPQLLGVQSGFCAGRSTVEQTMALRYILDMCRVSKHMTTIIFIDFNKAFDSIDRRAISIVLSKYGASELVIAIVIAVLHRDFCSSGHGTRKHINFLNNI